VKFLGKSGEKEMKISFYRKLIKSFIVITLLFPALIFNQLKINSGFFGDLVMNGISVNAAEKPHQKTRKTPAMRERVYSQLARAQKLADDNKVDEGLAVLDRVKSRIEQINSYEKAMLWNFYGFIYYGKNDLKSAISSFEKVVEQKNIPLPLELSTLYSLAQLQMSAEKYQKAIDYLERWSQAKDAPLDNNGLVLQANAFYALKDYQSAEEAISKVVADTIQQGKIPKENWLVLKRALHYELKQNEEVTQVSEQLVRHYSKAKYWIELSNIYGESRQTDKQLAVMEAAYQQGFVTKKIDIQTLAQLYFSNGAPYKSAKLLSKSLEDGIVLENIKILNYLAQAWMSAKEVENAIPVLKRAAKLSKSGNLDAKLAEAYIQLEQWENAIDAGKNARRKGDLDNLGSIYIAIGMAHFNLKQYSKAIDNFNLAKLQKPQKKVAEQWIRYAEKEKNKYEQLNSLMTSVGS